MTKIMIDLTPSTTGQFQVGDRYGYRSVVEGVSLTKITTCVADEPRVCEECTKDCPVRPKKSKES